jgi:predicted transcriptional regulator
MLAKKDVRVSVRKSFISDLRSSIVDKIIERGDVANELNLSSAVVSKIWRQFSETSSLIKSA